jgi:hypothetical protein
MNPEVDLKEVEKRTGFRFDAAGATATQPMSVRERQAMMELDPDGRFASVVNG